MTLYVSSHPTSPTISPTRTLKSESMDGIESIDYLDPLFPDILSSNFTNENNKHYIDHDIPSPSSSTSVHDTSSSSTTTPSPTTQYDIMSSDMKHIIPNEILNDSDHNLLHSSLTIPESYHHLTNEYYSRSNNIFNTSLLSSPLSDTLSTSTIDESLQIRVLGIPNLGAKSRVETQIKLCIQLMTSTGTKVPNWSYLRLPESMLARSKLRKTQQQKLLDGSVATMVSDESKVLTLDAKVVCSTNPSKNVRMCHGCVRRERKRAERTKDGKPRYETDLLNNNEKDPKQLAEEMMEKDRDRILLFNCSPMVNFSSGDAILPTRITCYCRHHNEKVGFKIQFVMRNDQGAIVAKGCSPPIMITDDHKSSKQRNGSIASNSTNNTNTSKKRGRSDFEPSQHQALDTPAPSRRGSFSDNNNLTSSTLSLNPSLAFTIPSSSSSSSPSPRDHTPSSPPEELQHIITPNSSLSSSPQTALIGHDLSMTPLAMDDFNSHHHHQMFSSESMADLLNSTRTPTEDTLNNDNNNNQLFFPQTINNNNNNNDNNNDNDILWPQSRRRRIGNNDFSTLNNNNNSPSNSTTTTNDNALWRTTEHTPQLERLVPSQGPTYGGVEVTVLGSGFYRGLTCLFGEHAANTVYWNPNTLVCVLPPAATPGPVVVSFKEHPIVLEGQDVALFTYYDASDQALLELALQVVGLKMTGKLLDAKHIAMLIVRGDQQRNQQQHQQQDQQNQNQQHDHIENNHHSSENIEKIKDVHEEDDDDDYNTDDDLNSEYDSDNNGDDDEDFINDNDSLDEWNWRGDTNLEKHIIDALEASNTLDMTHTNPCGHTMLHLAVLLQYGSLVKVLINKMDMNIIDQPDRNNCTALHFACLQNNAPMVSLLLQAGAQPDKKCSIGYTYDLTTDNNIRNLLKQQDNNNLITKPPSLSRRLSFKSHIRKFYRLKQSDDGNNQTEASEILDNDGLGFAHYKHDKRLYIFWLPLLIVTIGLLYYQILGDRTLLTLLQDIVPFARHRHLPSITGY